MTMTMPFSSSLLVILLASISMLPTRIAAFATPTNVFLEKGTVQHWQHEIGDNGAVDLHDLDFSTHQAGSGSGSTMLDIAIFALPSECQDSFDGCDTSIVGVGIHRSDDTDDVVSFCCTPELVDANKCDTPGRLLLDNINDAGTARYSGSLVTLDIPSQGTLEAAIFDHPLILVPTAGVYAVLMANCNEEDVGRTLHVTGDIEWIRHQDLPAGTNSMSGTTSESNHQDSHQQDPPSSGAGPTPSVDAPSSEGYTAQEEDQHGWIFLVIGFCGLALVAIFSWRRYQYRSTHPYDQYDMNRELHQLVVAEDDDSFYDLDSPGAPMPTHTRSKPGRNRSARRGSFRPETTLSTNL